ncbi:hypothetical protein [Hydrogenophaga sp.]
MYGWLTYTPQDLKARKGSSCAMWLPALQSPDENTLSNAARAQGAGLMVKFVTSPHFTGLDEAVRTALKADLLVLVNHIEVNEGLEFAMHMARQHHLLPADPRQQRTERIAHTVDAHFTDLEAPQERLMWRLGQLKTIGTVFPDVFMDFTMRSLCADYREYMTKGAHGLAKEPHYSELFALMLEAGQQCKRYPGDPEKNRDAVLRLFMTRPASELGTTMQRYRVLVKRERLDVLFKALQRAGAFSDVHESCRLDAVSQLMERLCEDPDGTRWDDAIELQLQSASALYAGLSRQAMCATIEALDQGLSFGQLRTEESRAAAARWRADAMSVSQRMTPTRAAQARANPVQAQDIAPGDTRPDIAITQAWSLDALASWIDGPVTGESTRALDPKAVAQALPKAMLLPPETTPRKPAPSPVKGQPQTPAQTPPKPLSYTATDVSGALLDSVSATARFLRDELQDLLALAPWPPQVKAQNDALRAQLLALAVDPQAHATTAGDLLTQAEQAVHDLRTGVKEMQATEQVQRRFHTQLVLALRAESLVMGKRHGGVIQCPARPSDWSYAVANFHNRCLPWVGSIEVDNALMPLDSHQAVALYVTGSSQSGYAFDVSVHLWRRRAGRTSPPSQETGAYPPMNTTDWFDTRVPCCVLHVPNA